MFCWLSGPHLAAPRGHWSEESSRLLSQVLFGWASRGFDVSFKSKAKAINTVLCVWLQPHAGTSARENRFIWNLYATSSATNTLHFLATCHDSKHFLRVILRGMSPRIQECMLFRRFHDHVWNQFILRLYSSIWQPKQESNACTYSMVSRSSSAWYVGQTKACRYRNGVPWAGWVYRFKEYFANTCSASNNQSHRQRYRNWRARPLGNIGLLPLLFGDVSHTVYFESVLNSNAPTSHSVYMHSS